MPLTPEQLTQLQQAKSAGAKRATIAFTVDQKQAWQAAVETEQAGKQETVDRFLKIKSAAEQPGIFGDVRRAILLSRRPVAELASAIGVDAEVLSDFRAGEVDLPAQALDRLASALGLRLMQEIPR